ncbi:MAG: DUF433 domain-containing protein [Zavarzinella sp.]|nr:DUF433 domain-containing protein [Zavarzinella sp.]
MTFLGIDANDRNKAMRMIRRVLTAGGEWYTWVKLWRKAMSLEGTVQNGVVVLDPGSPPLADGTRVEVAPRTGMEPYIRKTPGVCGGRACVGNRRIPVWSLVEYRQLGASDEQLMAQYEPPLSPAELDAAWRYAAAHPDEIAADIRDNNEDD